MGLQPVLQIVHVSDLHFKDIRSQDAKLLNDGWAAVARSIRRAVLKHDLFHWHEGVQGHYPAAPSAFLSYLEEVLIPNGSPAWFGAGPDRPPTWLVDTGDLTAFGDSHAIQLGKEWLVKWRNQLAADVSRELIGNHDAWAGCHPAFAIAGKVNLATAQKNLLSLSGWNRGEWITKPLETNIPGTKSRIELYALDSVCWDLMRNLAALGCIEAESIKQLRNHLKSRSVGSVPNFRILALHHPLVFPWEPSEKRTLGVIPVMRMLKENRVVENINNDACDPDVGPLAHLVLSGHTHAAHPSQNMPDDVTKITQGMLGDYQLQLVAGALMLNKTAIKVDNSSILRKVGAIASNFTNTSTDRTCQAQILRFYYDRDRPDELKMYRIPVFSVNGSIYRQGKASRTTMYLRVPRPS